MSEGKSQDRLTHKERMEVCGYLAEFRPVQDTVRMVRERFGKTISWQGVKHYLKSERWAQIIERFRKQYLANLAEVPIAHKRIRLERLEQLYKEAHEAGALSVCLKVLVEARAEMEGNVREQASVVVAQFTDLWELSAAELEERRRHVLEKLKSLSANTDSSVASLETG